jgi:putative glycosyltransferase (TIGR04372 family)
VKAVGGRPTGERLARVLRRRLGHFLDLVCTGLAPALSRVGVRFVCVDGGRIGESGASLAWFVQASRLGWIPGLRALLVPFPRSRFANPCYIDYWRKYIPVVSNRVFYAIAFRLANRPELVWPVIDVTLPDGRHVSRDRALALSQHRWEQENRSPLLALTPEHERCGRDTLASLGMGHDAWFVALHVRESGYLDEPSDSYRLHRNADVATYLPAAQKIVDRGGWVVRLGDPSMKPLPKTHRVIDYVHSHIYSDWMDVYLAGACRFFLGTSSGLFVVAWCFGRPCALANWDSLLRRPWASEDIFVPKLWWLHAEERYLTFDELLGPPYVHSLYEDRVRPSQYAALGVSPVDNTAEEIVDLVGEMLDRERSQMPEEETLRAAFEGVVAPQYPEGVGGRISTRFLARHRDLLPAAGVHKK